MSEFTVGYERKLSDGNYGSEGLSLTYTTTYDDEGDLFAIDDHAVAARCHAIASILREAVLGELALSNAERVAYVAARELSPPVPAVAIPTPAARGDSEDLEDLPF